MRELPLIMVAPNGARRTKDDHPEIPVSINELAKTAAACLEAGANAIHVHVRDQEQRHMLDAALYQAATKAITRETKGKMLVQITTEAVGRYLPLEQRQVVRDVMPEAVSIALGEMIPDESEELAAAEFYRFLLEHDIAVQHILYEPHEVEKFGDCVRREILPGNQHAVLFPLGRYVKDQQSDPASLLPFLAMLDEVDRERRCEWAVCAFGSAETRALAAALSLGGKVRVGFENSLWHADGSLARDNAERVGRISSLAAAMGLPTQ